MFKNVKIRTKLVFLFSFIFLAFIIILEAYIIPSVMTTIENQVKNKLKNIVQVAVSICENEHKLQQSGKISQQQAQNNAKEIIRNLRYNTTDYIWINDLQPKMVMHPFIRELEGQDLSNYKDPTGFKLFVAMVDIVKKKGEGFVKYQWEKPNTKKLYPKMSYVALFKPWGWVLGTGIYIDDLVEYQNKIKLTIRLIAGLILLIAILLIFTITLSLGRRLSQVEKMADALSHFDLSKTDELKATSSDEIGKMTSAFIIMSKNLKDMIKQIKDVASSVLDAAKELTSASSEIANVSEQIALAISDVAKGSSEQANSIEKSSQRLSALSNSVQDIYEKMKEAYFSVQAVHQTINNGQELILSQEQNMNRVKEIWQDVQNIMTRFSEMSNEIVKITSFITNLSKEINLLALNASIEASRAGEAGKGFMVVANEIRKLSEQTSTSAKQIGTLLKDIYENIQTISNQFEVFNKALETQDDITKQTKEVYLQILQFSKDFIEMINNVTKSAEIASSSISAISQEIANIASIAQETAAATQQTAASTEEQTATAQTIASTMKNLENLALQMAKKVEIFKI
ncbi:methyl-accepting chemotaxis sensory transducer with Cache sensor [Caldicellulosiruptor acetigenus I77R1B]|uniref:Methyl-accepting chemotaxis sensory transducer with Cache sensor n=1 Tax=Caldicellulosiruptor acetigenus (strain ATCC 700853 / DSM 12137 / I77R1B) TaxID=632335 RepID=E4S676_CALA7|nr:methyl-accepting chemotaxis protein [Caldicellulosiruptor acetigenus]ADQ40619.1 methyl-accepting chemotaxis sensory transducer with Cache sensor [Caldicellulosiruptor acetigenus I77R1B]